MGESKTRGGAGTRRAPHVAGRSKYGAVPTIVDNVRFASKREASRYQDLKLLERAGEINHLNACKKQLRYKLVVNGVLICTYECDFRYADKELNLIVEDAKGFKTPAYRIKKKLMKALYGIEIREV